MKTWSPSATTVQYLSSKSTTVTYKLTVWELRGKSKIFTKVPWLQIIHLYNLTLTLCIWYYQAVLLLLLNDAHYKSDCILLAIFREMLNKSYFRLLAYVPTLPRLLVLHKMLQRFLWNILYSKYYRNPRALLSRVACMPHKRCRRCIDHFTWHSPGGARILHGTVISFCIDIFIFVSYTKYHDAPIYRCIVSPLVSLPPTDHWSFEPLTIHIIMVTAPWHSFVAFATWSSLAVLVCQHMLARQLHHLSLFDSFFTQTSRVEAKIFYTAWKGDLPTQLPVSVRLQAEPSACITWSKLSAMGPCRRRFHSSKCMEAGLKI